MGGAEVEPGGLVLGFEGLDGTRGLVGEGDRRVVLGEEAGGLGGLSLEGEGLLVN